MSPTDRPIARHRFVVASCRLTLLLLLCSLLFGCGPVDEPVQPAEEEPETTDVCDEATQFVRECTGMSTTPFPEGSCDEESAREILALNCDDGTLKAPGKSDIAASDVLCAVGILSQCPVPACETALPYDHDFAEYSDISECVELAAKPGCGACDFYRCREALSTGQCGPQGYYLGFGYKYCTRYRQVTEPLMSPAGQQWSAGTRACLMDVLHRNIEDTDDCGGLIDAGYASHPECYLGTGFCDLSIGDWLLVLNTIDPKDLDFALMFETGMSCVAEYLTWSDGEATTKDGTADEEQIVASP